MAASLWCRPRAHRIAVLVVPVLLLGPAGHGAPFGAPVTLPGAVPEDGLAAPILAETASAAPYIGMVKDTISTTSGAQSPGNDPNTLNPRGPEVLAYDPVDGRVFIAYDPIPTSGFGPGYAGGIAVVDSSTGRVIGNISVGLQPDDVLYDPDNGYVYAVDWRSDQVLVIDPNTQTVLTTIGTGDTTDPVAIALDPVDDHLFVTESAGEGGILVINGSTNEQAGFIPDAAGPWWVVYDPANGELYVENWGWDNVSVFNATTGANVTTIAVTNGGSLGATGPIAYSPSDGDVYLPALDQPAVILGPTNAVVGTIPVPADSAGYWGFAYDPYYDGGVMLASVWGGEFVNVIDPTSNFSVIATLPVGAVAEGAVLVGSPAEVYAASWGSDTLARFNASTLAPMSAIRLATRPSAVAYDPGAGTMDVALTDAGQVLEVDVASGELERSISVGSDPDSLAFDPVDGEMYVANQGSNDVSILNATGVVGTVQVGPLPSALAVDPATGNVYVANLGNSTLTVLSGGSVARSFPVGNGSGPAALAFDPNSSRLFIVNEYWGNVSEYDPSSGSLVGGFTVGEDPVGVAMDPLTQQLFVLNYVAGNVNVTSAANLQTVNSTMVGAEPLAIAFDPANGLIYVANSNDNDLTAIDPVTDAALGNISVGYDPVGIAADGSLGSLYVVNQLSGSLSVVVTNASEVAVQFAESGLPSGIPWSVLFDGIVERSTGPNLTFSAANGSYVFAVSGPAGYTAQPSSGRIDVEGQRLLRPVQFVANTTSASSRTGSPWMELENPDVILESVALLGVLAGVVLVERVRRRHRPGSGQPPVVPTSEETA